MTVPADRLSAEIKRLFGHAEAARVAFLVVTRNADWPALSTLFAGLENDLELPLPALSVDARGGYRVWFSFAEPVAQADASAFLAALIRRYLGDLPAGRVHAVVAGIGAELLAMPAEDAESGRWSAFIDPGMGAMFRDEPGLDIPPGRDRQADLLASVRSLKPHDLARALQELGGTVVTATTALAEPPSAAVPSVAAAWQNVGATYSDPREFLCAVMNDPGASPEHRLRAAELLLRHSPQSSAG